MTKMDLLDKEIKGITGKFILWLVGSIATAIIFVLVTYSSTINHITASEYRLMSELKDIKANQKLVDTLQNIEINSLKKSVLKTAQVFPFVP